MIDPNLLFDEERFVGACSLVELIERESGFSQQLFVPKNAKRTVSAIGREGMSNIGSLGEGTLHLVIKNYISANRNNQEIKFGKKVVDVMLDGRAYEIQTRNFSSLKGKLDEFLPRIPVTVVFPVIREKRISWIDADTGEMSAYRKSPKKENVYSIFNELIYIKNYLNHKNLSFCVFEMDCDETKLLCGHSKDKKKKGAVRLNRVPTKLYRTSLFESASDFVSLLPDEREITVKSIAEYAKIDKALARKMIYCLLHAQILQYERTEKREKYYTLFQNERSTK